MTQHKSVESDFTPGPWFTQNEREDGWTIWAREPHIGTLATVHLDDINGDFPARENAHLIAAAPALYKELDSLRSLVGIMFGQGPDCILPETVGTPLGVPIQLGAMMRDTDAALSSARGNQS